MDGTNYEYPVATQHSGNGGDGIVLNERVTKLESHAEYARENIGFLRGDIKEVRSTILVVIGLIIGLYVYINYSFGETNKAVYSIKEEINGIRMEMVKTTSKNDLIDYKLDSLDKDVIKPNLKSPQ